MFYVTITLQFETGGFFVMKGKKRAVALLSILSLIFIGLYVYQAKFYDTHFYPKAVVNNIPIGNMTVDEAAQRLEENHSKVMVSIKNDKSVWKEMNVNKLGLTYDVTPSLKKQLKKQNNYLWLAQRFATHQVQIDNATLDERAFEKETVALKNDIDTLNQERNEPQDATITSTESGLVITPEVEGNTLDSDRIINELKTTLTKGDSELDLNRFIKHPKVKADDDHLKEALATGKKISEQSAVHIINGKDIEIPKETLASWVTYNPDEQAVSLNHDSVSNYIQELGKKYNTSTNDLSFKSTKRGDVTVPAGTYSWTIQTDAETEALTKELLAGNGVKRAPIVNGSATPDKALVGDTYVEVDLKNQHMYFYKNGKLFLDTDVVTGKPTTVTPPGVFYVWSKEENATLRGTNDDGSKYAEPVDYWMPIDWTGVGLHDSPWQAAYGGSRWADGFGSHGCVNTPPELAAKLFNNIEIGTPVLVF